MRPCVLVIQDTTEIDFSHMKTMEGCGPLNQEDRRRGFHALVYVLSEADLPLGMLDTAIVARRDEGFRQAAARQLAGCEVFSISDWEGDIYEVFEAWAQSGGDAPGGPAHRGALSAALGHRGLSPRFVKTGCRVEALQLKGQLAVLNCLVLYEIIAWRGLRGGRVEGRLHGGPPRGKKRAPLREPTLGEFIALVAKFGGHPGRRSDQPPGAQAIWQGLARVRDFACAWEAIHQEEKAHRHPDARLRAVLCPPYFSLN